MVGQKYIRSSASRRGIVETVFNRVLLLIYRHFTKIANCLTIILRTDSFVSFNQSIDAYDVNTTDTNNNRQ